MCHTETSVWGHCLRPKKAALRTFRRLEKCFKCVILHERPTNVCILPVMYSRRVQYFIIHCQWLKIDVDFRGESVRRSPTPSLLAYVVYAFINLDNCERPLTHIVNHTYLQINYMHELIDVLRLLSYMHDTDREISMHRQTVNVLLISVCHGLMSFKVHTSRLSQTL